MGKLEMFVQESPFVEMEVQPTGPKFTGYCIDMLDEIAKHMNFEYEIYNASEYGKLVGKTWVGAVGEVAYKAISFICFQIFGVLFEACVTEGGHSREWDVDHVDAGRRRGLQHPLHGLRSRNPDQEDGLSENSVRVLGTLECQRVGLCRRHANSFYKTKIMHFQQFVVVSGTIFIAGALLFVVTRLSPCTRDIPLHEGLSDYSKFTLHNSIWFTMTSIMQQGRPRRLSNIP